MNTLFTIDLLIPIGLLILQILIVLFISISIMRMLKIIKTPYAGMEYGQLIVASAFLMGTLIINMADVQGLFQSFKTYQNSGNSLFKNTFSKGSQFFLIIFVFIVIYTLIFYLVSSFFWGIKNFKKHFEEGNIPTSILLAVTIVGTAVGFELAAKEIIIYLIPQYLNLR